MSDQPRYFYLGHRGRKVHIVETGPAAWAKYVCRRRIEDITEGDVFAKSPGRFPVCKICRRIMRGSNTGGAA